MTIVNRYTVEPHADGWAVMDDESSCGIYGIYSREFDAMRTAARLNALQRDNMPGAWKTDPEVLEVERVIEEAQRYKRLVKPLLLILLLAWSAPATAQTAPTAALVAGSTLDLATSVRALQQPNTREANPFLAHGGTAGLVAGKVATTAGLVWVMHRLATSGHATAAKVIGFGGGALLTSIAIRNERLR